MSIKKAVELFIGAGGRPRLNCGQAVAEAFKEKFGLSDEFIATLAFSGLGEAPGGVCGALYAAQAILREAKSGRAEAAREEFAGHAGSSYCVDIRKSKKLSCVGCVKKASGILDAVQGPEQCIE